MALFRRTPRYCTTCGSTLVWTLRYTNYHAHTGASSDHLRLQCSDEACGAYAYKNYTQYGPTFWQRTVPSPRGSRR